MVEEFDGISFCPLLPLAGKEHSPSFTPTEVDSPNSKRKRSRSRSPKGKDSANEAARTVPLSSNTDVPYTEDDELFYPGFQLNDSSGPSFSDRVWLHNDNYEEAQISMAAARVGCSSYSSSSGPPFFCIGQLNQDRQHRKSLRKHQINDMVNSLPLSCQTEAENRLAVIEGISDIKLMVDKSPSSHIEGLIKSNCKFYIGITERPKERWTYWMGAGYKEMALWIHPSRKETVPMEKYLISRFRASHLMANLADGGQIASAATPHFLYVVSK